MAGKKEVEWLGEGADKAAVGVPVPVGSMKLVDESGGSLELVRRKGEPAVLVDGKHLIRRSTLVRQLADVARERGDS